jgi:hypothetical protein
MSVDELRARIADAASLWAIAYPIPSWQLAHGPDAEQLARAWGQDIADAVMAVVGPEVQYLREELTDVSARNGQLEEDVEKLGRRIDRVRFLHEADDADPDECNQCSTHAPCPTLKAIGDRT